MSAYSRLLASQVDVDPETAKAADAQHSFSMGDTSDEDGDESVDGDDAPDGPSAKRARTEA